MNVKVFALLLTLGFAPALVAAQTSSPPPAAPAASPAAPARMSPELMRAHMAAFRRFHEQLATIHRAFVGRVLGELAVATTPDRRYAVSRIDAILTTSEKDAIFAAQRSAMEQMRAQMQQMRAQMQSQAGGMQGRVVAMHAGTMGEHEHRRHAPDAGAALLRGLLPGPPMMQMMMMMRMHAHPMAPAQP